MDKKLERALELFAEAVGESKEKIIENAVRKYLVENLSKVEDNDVKIKIKRLLRGEDEDKYTLYIEEVGITINLREIAKVIREILERSGGIKRYREVMEEVFKRFGYDIYSLPKEVIILKQIHSSFFRIKWSVPSLSSYLIFESNGEFKELNNVYIVGYDKRYYNGRGILPIIQQSFMIIAENDNDMVRKAIPLIKQLQSEIRKTQY